ncbi:DEAD/DEAH box helicase [Dehalobacter sp. DCM]|uniref:DEAD/DEAH box helicase n=1 Tax=Dehalobacter sp. DCM TaxID=2907827 RepID=UPI0030813B26|nr:DEAD/DEAH box helicase [Dehalobacter sp. DCM]
MFSFYLSEPELKAIATSRRVYDAGTLYAHGRKVGNFSYNPEKGVIDAQVFGTDTYDVHIELKKDGSLHTYYCTCPAYEQYPGACKHIIAVLKTAQQKLADPVRSPESSGTSVASGAFSPRPDTKRAASDFMAIFADRKPLNTGKELLNLELELEINTDYLQSGGQLQLKIGTNRLYVVKNLKEFLYAIKHNHLMEFGMKFTYDPAKHVFSAQDQQVIHMLREMLEQYEAVNEVKTLTYSSYSASPFTQKPFVLSRYYLRKFLDVVGSKQFFLHAGSSKALRTSFPMPTTICREDLPLDFSVESAELDLVLTLQSKLPVQLTADGAYYLYERQIYGVSPGQAEFLPNLIKLLAGKHQPGIIFPANQKDIFVSEALPRMETLGTVSIEPELAAKFIREELQPKLFFDRINDTGITVRLEFHYGDIIINPFSAQGDSRAVSSSGDHVLIRDMEKERKILEIFEQADFTVSEGRISLDDEDKLFDFTLHGFSELHDLAETYYSDDFKLKIHYATGFTGRVRLDDNLDMLEISFAYGDIDRAELADIFHSLKTKKKYYRLRDGSFLDLQQQELNAMSLLIDHLDLKEKDLTKDTIQLPKFRAMYIDNFLRQENLPGIQRNRAFKQLVQSILEPQDNEFDPPSTLQHILRDYQKTGYKWLKTLSSYGLGGILADDMGLGKTLQVLAFILSEKLKNDNENIPSRSFPPALVIAPTSLVYNWRSEAEKFTPELKVMVIDGTPQERQDQLTLVEQADLVVVSYAVLRRDIDTFANLSFSYCFLDEAQNIKNANTLNAKSVQKIQAGGYFALTGTPIENALSELWSLFHFLLPGYLYTQLEFHKKYAAPISKGDAGALQELSRHTRPFILRRLKKEVLKELPPKIETEIKAALTDEQRKIYLAYLQQTKSQIAQELAVSGFAKSQIKILAALTRLRQICSHPGMFIENYTGDSGKMLLFQELLAEALDGGHRILVFSQFTSMLDILADYFNREKVPYFYLSGSTKASERAHMVQEFNSGCGEVFLISLKAGGTGLNLTGADTVIHFDPWWNPAVEDQATDRAHRIGQNNTVQVIKLLTQGTIEEKVNALQAKKKKLIDAVIQPGETLLTKLTEHELKELFEMS